MPGSPPARQRVSFCTSPDGTRIAIAAVGSGPPLLRAAHWLSHVEHDMASPVWWPWLDALSRRHTYIRYDQRGCGLSDARVDDFSLEAWVADLEAVADHLQLRRFPLLGMSQGGAVAIAYAVKHPERVSRLVLVGAYARGAMRRPQDPQARLEAETLGWNELERLSASPENAARTLEAFHQIDVSALAGRLSVPTLVLHARGDARVPFEEGRHLAALIPQARFVPLTSDNHVLLESEPAWPAFLEEVDAFVGAPEVPARLSVVLNATGLTVAEAAVLQLVARGLDNRAIGVQLHKSEKTVRNQLSSIFAKMGVRTRAEAIVRVRDKRPG